MCFSHRSDSFETKLTQRKLTPVLMGVFLLAPLLDGEQTEPAQDAQTVCCFSEGKSQRTRMNIISQVKTPVYCRLTLQYYSGP